MNWRSWPRVLVAAMAVFAAPAGAAEKVIVLSKGGAYQDAQRKAYFEPFTRETGIEVVEASGVDFARIRALIDSGNPQVDVMDTSAQDYTALKKLNLLQKIDYAMLKPEDRAGIPHKYVDDYGVPNILWSMILAYNEKTYRSPPRSWADFWNTAQFPGLRASGGARIPPLEQAAFAMGVAPDRIYAMPVDDMMNKIKELGDKVTFATTPQMVQFLASGEVGMAVTSNGRVEDLRAAGKPIAIQWNQGVINIVYFTIPNGAPNPANAMKLIEFTSRAKPQAELAKQVFFGPVNTKAYDYLDAATTEKLPNTPSRAAQQIVLDAEWWGEKREEINKKWNAIVLGQ
jgi:putative spermidine/putrescine transport system substrate-binding protein